MPPPRHRLLPPRASAPANAAPTGCTASPGPTDGCGPGYGTGRHACAGKGGLDGEVQSLKKDVVNLNRNIFVLEEELLFPANTQVTVLNLLDVKILRPRLGRAQDQPKGSNSLYFALSEVAGHLKFEMGGIKGFVKVALKVSTHRAE